MKKGLTISYDELMKELDSFRGTQRITSLTKEQEKFLLESRNHHSPVAYRKMAELWARVGWGKISAETLRNFYLKLQETK